MGKRPHAAVLRVGIGGLGAIGSGVVRALQKGMDGLQLCAVADADEAFAVRRARELGCDVPIVRLEELAGLADVVIEASATASFLRIAQPAVAAARVLIPLSVGGLLEHPDLIELAARTGARIHVPSGAMAGIDALRAVAEGVIHSVRLITRKPPRSLEGSPRMVELGLSADNIATAVQLFEGSAREGARLFPANANVAAAIGLAGIGPDATRFEVWADPTVTCNTHTVVVTSDSSDVTITIQNRFAKETPRTGLITHQSVVATLRGLIATVKFGT
jgi:aspartate dehydrogenase